MNESIKVIIIYGLVLSGLVSIAFLFLLGLYRLMSGFFRGICKRINKHKP